MPTTRSAIPRMQASDFATDLDLRTDELVALLALTEQVRERPSEYAHVLDGQYLSLLFEKPSLRTRLTFELAIAQLGGGAVVSIGTIGDREPLKDIARNLDRWTNAIVARTFTQHTIDELARYSSVPVINALSDLYHPCQALADMATLQRHLGSVRGRRLAFVGDGNNVAHSLMLCAARLGAHFSIATPPGYQPAESIVSTARELAGETGAQIRITTSPAEAVRDADAIYTDVWASMGQESEAAQRRETFGPYQVNDALLENAPEQALFMHCLPAKRDQEVTDSVIESRHSVVFDQAEYRLHAQKALLLMLLAR